MLLLGWAKQSRFYILPGHGKGEWMNEPNHQSFLVVDVAVAVVVVVAGTLGRLVATWWEEGINHKSCVCLPSHWWCIELSAVIMMTARHCRHWSPWVAMMIGVVFLFVGQDASFHSVAYFVNNSSLRSNNSFDLLLQIQYVMICA